MVEIRCVWQVVSFFCHSRFARDSKKARVPSVQFELGTPPAHDRHREKGRHSSENMATTSPSAMDHVSKKPKLADGEDAMDVDDKENRKIAKVAFDHETHMRIYYDSLFPAESMMKWLAYGNDLKHPQADTGFMQRREFCFTLPGDVFVRYQSFKDDKELRKELKSKLPSKIDIGPVFNVDPSKRLAYSGGAGSDRVFAPTEREFVMDIDMTDYDDVRTCCSAASSSRRTRRRNWCSTSRARTPSLERRKTRRARRSRTRRPAKTGRSY